MLGWVFKPKARTARSSGQTPAEVTGDDLEYLRNQVDFDAEEMAAVHALENAQAASDPPFSPLRADDPGVTRPGIRVSSEQSTAASGSLNAAGAVKGFGEAGELVLSVRVADRCSVVSIREVALIGRFDLEQDLTPEVDLSVDDAVSRRHARIIRRGGQYWLRDLDSTNGTQLNGRWLAADTDVPLQGGDLIKLGEASELRVLDISFGVELTAEDQQLSELLDQAIGLSSAAEPELWPLTAAGPVASAGSPVDLLNVALSCGAEAGLLPADAAEPVAPMAPPQWRLRELDDVELPSFVEPYR